MNPEYIPALSAKTTPAQRVAHHGRKFLANGAQRLRHLGQSPNICVLPLPPLHLAGVLVWPPSRWPLMDVSAQAPRHANRDLRGSEYR